MVKPGVARQFLQIQLLVVDVLQLMVVLLFQTAANQHQPGEATMAISAAADFDRELLKELEIGDFEENVTDEAAKLSPAVISALQSSGAWEELVLLAELNDNIDSNPYSVIRELASTALQVINVARQAVESDVKSSMGIN